MTLMMLIISVVYVLKTLDRYNWLAEYLCSVNYVQTYVFQILEENLHDMVITEDIGYLLAGFR